MKSFHWLPRWRMQQQRFATLFYMIVLFGGLSLDVWAGQTQEELHKALAGMYAWLDTTPHGAAWREYLQSARLEKELAQGTQADPQVLVEVLGRYYGEADGLELAPFVRVREALKDWLTEITGDSWKGLAQQVRASQKVFLPFGPRTVQRVQGELKAAVAALDERLTLAGSNGQNWRDYLAWNDLIEQIRRGQQADLDRLDAIYYKFDAGFEGLGLYWFTDVRRALQDWLIVLRTTDQAELKTNYRTVLANLAQELEKLGPIPTAEQTVGIGQMLSWLQDARQSPWLVENIRRRFGRANLKTEVSASLVQAGLDRSVEDVSPVVDWILGTEIHGTGRTEGKIISSLVTNAQAAEVLLHFTGVTYSETIGYNGPARIYTNGQTTLRAGKRLWILPEGLQVGPTVAEAQTQTDIEGIGLVRGGRLIERIAWKRTCQSKPTAEWIAARHAEDRLQQRLDQQMEKEVSEANRRLTERLRQPLWERRLWPEQIQLRSTERAVELSVCQAQPVQLAAAADPPSPGIPSDLLLQVHETMVNNTAASALSGMILTDEHFDRARQEPGVFGQLFQELPTQREGEPWALYFAHGQPVLAVFRDGKFTITIHGRAFRRGETRYPGMDITAVYRIEKTPEGYRAVREGELRIFPSDFEPGRQLSVQEQVLKELLQRRFEKIFPPEMIPQPVVLPETWPSVGKLQLVYWEARDGWLTVAWRRIAADSPSASSTPPTGQ